MAFNTGKPVPSRDPRDLIDNAESFDIRATSREVRVTPDRLGAMRKTWHGMEQDFAEFLAASGFEPNHLTYQDGVVLQVDRPTQLIDYGGSVFRVKMPASFPVVLDGLWASDSTLLTDIGDDSLRADLANTANPDKGASMMGYKGKTVSGWLERVIPASEIVSDELVHYSVFGIVGSTFESQINELDKILAARAYCVAHGLKLFVGSLKIYLGALSEPINLDGWGIVGSDHGPFIPYDDWGIIDGTSSYSDLVLPRAYSSKQSIFFAHEALSYVFTGKVFNCENIGIVCNWDAPCGGFIQSDVASYPGWSQATAGMKNVSVAYAGADALHIKGGLEVSEFPAFYSKYCKGHGIYVGTTLGVDSPIEYLRIGKGVQVISSKLSGIKLDGVRKHLLIEDALVNDAGLIRLLSSGRTVPGTVAPTSIDNLVPGVELVLSGTAFPFNIVVNGLYGEYLNLLVATTGNYTNIIRIQNTTQYGLEPAGRGWVWATARIRNANTREGVFDGNRCSLGTAKIDIAGHTQADSSWFIGAIQQAIGIRSSALGVTGVRNAGHIGGGNGSAGSFTLGRPAPEIERPQPDTPSRWQMFLVAANFQGNTLKSGGAYLLAVTRLANNEYFGVVFPSGDTAGFTSAPTVLPDGSISVTLAQYYRASITRIDYSAPTGIGSVFQ